MGKLSNLSPNTPRTIKKFDPTDSCTVTVKKIHSYSTHSCFSRQLVDKYDAFILDQFGVLHNGQKAIPGAVDLIEYLCKKNKKLIILSNTSAPADKALLKLPKLGFNPECFVGMVTSGEEASKYIRKTYDKKKALMFTWDTTNPNSPRLTAMPQAFLDHCGDIEVAETVEEADFLLLHGSEVWYRGDSKESIPLGTFIDDGLLEGTIENLLQQCLERNLPCVCANPDVIVQNPTGEFAYMPGKIAQRYAEIGGDCHIFGKPQAEHFKACLRMLGLPASRVAHVGDSLHHDIAGANAAGVANILVTGGIHLSQLNGDFGELPDNNDLENLFIEEGSIFPTHVVPAFRR